ncbi:hypothetical protein L211DRAFT_839597 [Terfezia boudieri ATCC MYA-4762]|uniref:Uncharacterized protein n=1 Tax=Terfezia boudieri ATCC MYA-4762 TaxID=1051890 RepID=A0A3N4LPE8_9PEZI|nr:hypothetical protein L211DRAFT_839597 [Terfezia boudieri ATCC MYA-4762]
MRPSRTEPAPEYKTEQLQLKLEPALQACESCNWTTSQGAHQLQFPTRSPRRIPSPILLIQLSGLGLVLLWFHGFMHSLSF